MSDYTSEVLKIIQGALTGNQEKVIRYARFYADKLESDGEKSSADRVRQIIKNPEGIWVKPMLDNVLHSVEKFLGEAEQISPEIGAALRRANAGVPIPRVDAYSTKTVK